MDPGAIVTSVIAGVAQKVGEKSAEFAMQVLGRLYQDFFPMAKERAEGNVKAFLGKLEMRVADLEATTENPEVLKDRLLAALEDPDRASAVHSAIVSSSRTESPEKREVLAAVLMKKLQSEPESTESLAATQALEAIPALAPAHIYFLAAKAVLSIPPESAPGISDPMERCQAYLRWVKWALDKFPQDLSVNSFDIAHMISVGCLAYGSGVAGDLTDLFHPRGRLLTAESLATVREFLENDPIGRLLQRLWDSGLGSTSLSSSGWMIGSTACDGLTGDGPTVNSVVNNPSEGN